MRINGVQLGITDRGVIGMTLPISPDLIIPVNRTGYRIRLQNTANQVCIPVFNVFEGHGGAIGIQHQLQLAYLLPLSIQDCGIIFTQ